VQPGESDTGIHNPEGVEQSLFYSTPSGLEKQASLRRGFTYG
jgi:hypothetical protein